MAQRGSLVEIDLDELERLCGLQCTDEELAAWFKVSTRTIERRRKEPEFAEVMARGKARGRLSIRRAQLKMLEQGNATMGVWLGKQHLGQQDRYPDGAGQQPVYIISPAVKVTTRDAIEPPADQDLMTIDIGPGR